jgi:plastocyanin
MKRLAVMALVATLGGAGACGGGSSGSGSSSTTSAGPAMTATVVAKNLAFTPATVRLQAGGTVTWKLNDSPTPHNVTATDKAYASENLTSGEYTHTYDQPGTYKYTCTIHPGMKGTVIVT